MNERTTTQPKKKNPDGAPKPKKAPQPAKRPEQDEPHHRTVVIEPVPTAVTHTEPGTIHMSDAAKELLLLRL